MYYRPALFHIIHVSQVGFFPVRPWLVKLCDFYMVRFAGDFFFGLALLIDPPNMPPVAELDQVLCDLLHR